MINAIILNDPSKGEWFLSCLYGTPYKEDQVEQWEYIKDLSKAVNIPWVVLGDLNITLDGNERVNHASSSSNSSITQLVREADLMDLGFNGNPFTWTSNKHGTDVSLTHVTQNGSDRTPILLQLYHNLSVKGKNWKFFENWLHNSTCATEIENSWTIDVSGSTTFVFMNKLINTRKQLSLWKKNTFGHIQRTISQLKDQMTSLQQSDINGSNTHKLLQLEDEIAKWDDIKSSFWRQQVKDKFHGEMDMNTKYFHTRANMRRSRNKIDSLLDPDGTW
ncbi:uncharacterized protein LOC113360391 [Papaver somniferum]|uniref:uncharacterized protein LOC113360391 n=1 Tax=Papaver somniferum TaxID=3469 RepID=UPI000E7003F5|nr:uncharacterized protein LOC113360391 [Papaver somniferum]